MLCRLGKFYVKVMDTLKSKAGFAATEEERLKRMLEGNSVSGNKVDEFTMRRNILKAFQ